jgi:hypothetical protein
MLLFIQFFFLFQVIIQKFSVSRLRFFRVHNSRSWQRLSFLILRKRNLFFLLFRKWIWIRLIYWLLIILSHLNWVIRLHETMDLIFVKHFYKSLILFNLAVVEQRTWIGVVSADCREVIQVFQAIFCRHRLRLAVEKRMLSKLIFLKDLHLWCACTLLLQSNVLTETLNYWTIHWFVLFKTHITIGILSNFRSLL